MAVSRPLNIVVTTPWQVEVWQVSSPRALQALVNRAAATRLSDMIFHTPIAKSPLTVTFWLSFSVPLPF